MGSKALSMACAGFHLRGACPAPSRYYVPASRPRVIVDTEDEDVLCGAEKCPRANGPRRGLGQAHGNTQSHSSVFQLQRGDLFLSLWYRVFFLLNFYSSVSKYFSSSRGFFSFVSLFPPCSQNEVAIPLGCRHVTM